VLLVDRVATRISLAGPAPFIEDYDSQAIFVPARSIGWVGS